MEYKRRDGDVLIRKVLFDECQMCDKTHEVEEWERIDTAMVQGQKVSYTEKIFFCQNASDDMNMFVNGGMLNENLTRCRNAYRIQNGLLTSKESAGIREEYGLTSEEFSKILGFKEDRIKRLEAKVIQDKETDQLIRRFHTDKDFAADLVQKSVNALPEGKSEEVLKKLKKTQTCRRIPCGFCVVSKAILPFLSKSCILITKSKRKEQKKC